MRFYLCGNGGCCPAVEIAYGIVRIGEDVNMSPASEEGRAGTR